jgi:hypothetical protein
VDKYIARSFHLSEDAFVVRHRFSHAGFLSRKASVGHRPIGVSGPKNVSVQEPCNLRRLPLRHSGRRVVARTVPSFGLLRQLSNLW